MATLISLANTGELKMRALFNGRPTLEEIHQGQQANGYGANGFPSKVVCEEVPSKCCEGLLVVVTFNLQGG